MQGSTRDPTINLAVASNLQVRITHTEWAASKLSFEAKNIDCAYIGAQFVRGSPLSNASMQSVSMHVSEQKGCKCGVKKCRKLLK